jgi:hypothetical protein
MWQASSQILVCPKVSARRAPHVPQMAVARGCLSCLSPAYNTAPVNTQMRDMMMGFLSKSADIGDMLQGEMKTVSGCSVGQPDLFPSLTHCSCPQ